MTRSRLKNKFLRCRSDENKKAHNEQRNRCVKLVRSEKKKKKKLIVAILPLRTLLNIRFFEKMNTNKNITLADNNNIMSSEIEIAEKLNALFSNIIVFI